MTIWNWLEEITYKKSPINSFNEQDWESFNSYMIHRFISMNSDYIDIVNYVQEFPPQEKKMIYNIYKEFIPKNNKWNKPKTKKQRAKTIIKTHISGSGLGEYTTKYYPESGKFHCTCPGYWRSGGNCKHVKQMRNETL